MNDQLLGIYLNDHLAGATLGQQLAQRAAEANRGSALGSFLETLLIEIKEDRDALQQVMSRVGARENPAKRALALAAERAGRLKPNGRLRGYSPLSRLIELEGLSVGVAGKRALWGVLAELQDPRLAAFDFHALLERAERQRDQIEPHRLAASRSAFEHSS